MKGSAFKLLLHNDELCNSTSEISHYSHNNSWWLEWCHFVSSWMDAEPNMAFDDL